MPCAALFLLAFHAQSEILPPITQGEPAASQNLKGLSLEQLGNVEVVTYSKTPTELWSTPTAMFVITNEDIIRSGVTNIADALRLAPGVDVGQVSSTTWAVGIRGLNNNFSKSVLVLIDGRNVYTPLFAGVYWDVQDLPLDDIDRIEVIRGPGGTIWGPNAANGVINIITKHATETQGVTVNALAGTTAHTIDDLQYGGAGHNVSYRMFGRGFERGHEYYADGVNVDEWHEERFGFRVDRTTTHNAYLAEGDLYGGDSPRVLSGKPVEDDTAGGDVNLRWEHTQANGSGFTLQTYFERAIRSDPLIGETRNTADIEFVQNFALAARQQFSYGGGLRFSPYDIIAPVAADSLQPAVGLDHVYTGFVQDEIRLSAKVTLTAGAKMQHNNYSGFDVQPSGRLLWTPGQDQTLWLGVSRAVTTPSDLEEDFHLEGLLGPNEAIVVAGNHNFRSEDLLGYEIGYRKLVHSRMFVDVTAFWNQYRNLQSFSAPIISSSGGITYLTIQYQNQISGSTTGFEIAPQLAAKNWWRFDTTYSFLNSDFNAFGATSDISSSGSVNTYEKSSPRHTVTVQSKIDLPHEFKFDQMYRFVSALPAQKVEAYQTMDLRFGRALGEHFSFEAVGQNLFQPHHYEWGTGDPSQPNIGIFRAAYVQLTFHADPQVKK